MPLPANSQLVNKKVELKSTGTGASSVSTNHRRVQTRSDTTAMEGDGIIDTHSPDGSGSPGADSGVFSSSTEKYEIIQKDIGYSSDADMSDAIEVRLQSCPPPPDSPHHSISHFTQPVEWAAPIREAFHLPVFLHASLLPREGSNVTIATRIVSSLTNIALSLCRLLTFACNCSLE